MQKPVSKENDYGNDVLRLNEEKEYIIVGTAHISRQSVDLVRKVIEAEKPDCVCVELDEQRYKALSEKKKWQNLDLRAVIREKQISTLFINILLSSFQKRLGQKLGVMPGTELLEAIHVAEENHIPVVLADRNVRITLRRAWSSMSFWQKMKFLAFGLAGIFERPELDEEELAKLRQKDVLTELLKEMGKFLPVLKHILLDERDLYLSQKIKAANGNKIVAVVGAGHREGIAQKLRQDKTYDLEPLDSIPPPSKTWKWFAWGLPVFIIGSLVYIGFTKGSAAAGDNALFWVLANGVPCALGAILAFAHPLTILIAFLAAPITSLTPVIGAGYVAVFVQAYFRPPVVKEFETVSDDVAVFRAWWRNKLLRIFLVFLLTGLGSAIGTYVGMYEIISNLF